MVGAAARCLQRKLAELDLCPARATRPAASVEPCSTRVPDIVSRIDFEIKVDVRLFTQGTEFDLGEIVCCDLAILHALNELPYNVDTTMPTRRSSVFTFTKSRHASYV